MEKILLVDNEPKFLAEMEQIVRNSKHNFNIEKASSCNEAKGKIANNDYSIIITDMAMEEENSGLEILRVAKEKNIYTQIIVVTNYEKPTLEIQAMAEGAFDFIKRGSNIYVRSLFEKFEEAIMYQRSKIGDKK